jgi:capsule polysaccharide export protein KpsE/RkpR
MGEKFRRWTVKTQNLLVSFIIIIIVVYYSSISRLLACGMLWVVSKKNYVEKN